MRGITATMLYVSQTYQEPLCWRVINFHEWQNSYIFSNIHPWWMSSFLMEAAASTAFYPGCLSIPAGHKSGRDSTVQKGRAKFLSSGSSELNVITPNRSSDMFQLFLNAITILFLTQWDKKKKKWDSFTVILVFFKQFLLYSVILHLNRDLYNMLLYH